MNMYTFLGEKEKSHELVDFIIIEEDGKPPAGCTNITSVGPFYSYFILCKTIFAACLREFSKKEIERATSGFKIPEHLVLFLGV